MKRNICIVSCLISVGMVFAGPLVDNVAIVQDADTREVRLSYDLDGEPAVVSLKVSVDGRSVDATALGSAVGDVNRLIPVGTGKRISWRPDKTWAGNPTNAVVSLVATSPANGPDYLVVDLSKDFTGELAYYPTAEALPFGGLTNDLYRTERLVLRRIPAANVTWLMGSPTTEGSRGQDEVQHRVCFSHDYYMAVFETTQAQYQKLMGRNPSMYTGDVRPVDKVYGGIRDAGASEEWSGGAFRSAEPNESSFLGILCARTGLDFDLPTEAEWEFACRAGTTSSYNNRTDKEDGSLYGKYLLSGDAKDPASTTDPSVASARVGSYRPNAWGLYDMSGNIAEWCLDSYSTDRYGFDSLDGILVDPVNLTNETQTNGRVRRGGSWRDPIANGRSAYRLYWNAAYKSIGFRVVCKGAKVN